MSETSKPAGRNLWPYALVTFFGLFIAWTVGFVIWSASHQVELVAPNYYEQELRFQQELDRSARSRTLTAPVKVSYDRVAHHLTVVLPPEHSRQKPACRVHLYRPSAAGMDRALRFTPSGEGEQLVPLDPLADGLWRVRIAWTIDGHEYAHDEKLVVQVPKPG